MNGYRRKGSAVQTLIPSPFKQPHAGNSDQAKAYAIGVFIAADLRPYSVVENTGFRHIEGD